MEMSQSYCTKIYKIVFTIMKKQIPYNNYFFPLHNIWKMCCILKKIKNIFLLFAFAAWGCSTEKSESQRKKLTLKCPINTKRVGLDIFEFGSFFIIPLTKNSVLCINFFLGRWLLPFQFSNKQKTKFPRCYATPRRKGKK